MQMARTMLEFAKLPDELWPEVLEAATYVHNRLPSARNNWRSPHELVFNYRMLKDGLMQGKWHIPSLAHFRAYGCKAYVRLTDNKLKARKNHYKMHARAEIGYLVGYQSSNIYKIWIPHLNQIRCSRDVLFDEQSFFDGKMPETLEPRALKELQEVIDLVTEPNDQVFNEMWQLPTWAMDTDNEPDPPFERPRNNNEIYQRLVGFHIPDPEDESSSNASTERSSVFSTESLPIDGLSNEDSSIYNYDPRDRSFDQEHYFGFRSADHERAAFFIGRTINKSNAIEQARLDNLRIVDLPRAPKRWSDVKGHMFEKEFRQAEVDHLKSHEATNSWEIVDKQMAKDLNCKILGTMWVYVYKENEDSTLKKCKARLVVRGDQEAKVYEDTYAATLAARTFRILMALTAKYDLDAIQLDIVNAFMNAEVQRNVFVEIPQGFRKEPESRCYRLNRAMYGLRQSPLLWQKHITRTFEALGFTIIPQEPCVMIKDDLILFFYVDDIGMLFPKGRRAVVEEILAQLRSKYDVTGGEELEWFLGVRVLRDRKRRKLWLSQTAYCDKMFAQHADERQQGVGPQKYFTPLYENADLNQSLEKVPHATREKFQRRTGAAQYAASVTRPDIAFAAARLARHNHNPSHEAQVQANRLINYLKCTRSWVIEYDGFKVDDAQWQIFSDASHADDTLDRKSSQGYVFIMCGGPVAWKASKQSTVTTSSTEAELLALSETARETIFLARILRSLDKSFEQPPIIHCDNQMTMRLLKEETAILNTRLRHVDIHNHWLRQEIQRKHIELKYVPSKDNIADGFTKALGRQKFETFRRQLGLVELMDDNDDRTDGFTGPKVEHDVDT
jgi:hypothetical protein